MNTQAQNQQALTYYNKADHLAHEAAAKIAEARELTKSIRDSEERIQTWERKIKNAPLFIWTIVFVIVAVVEYFISYPIYEVVIGQAPAWIIALGFIGLGMIASHFMAEKLLPAMKEIKFYEYRRDPSNNGLTDEEIWHKIQKETNRYFWFGLILGGILIVIIYYMAVLRVNYEFQAELRSEGFGISDWLPVVLYATELILGMWAVKLFLLYWKKFKLYLKKNKLKKLIGEISKLTALSIENLKKALERGYNVIQHPVSDEVQTALFREDNLSADDFENYIGIPEKKKYEIQFKFTDSQGKALNKYVEIISHYLVSASGGTENGLFKITIDTFEGDSIQQIVIKDTAVDQNGRKITGTYSLNNKQLHNIILNNE